MNQNLNLASWRVRGAAYLIDGLVPFMGAALFSFGVMFAVGVGIADGGAGFQQEGLRRPDTPLWLFPLVSASAVGGVGYFVWWRIALKDGQTQGKKIVGIRAVRASTGETLGWGMTFVRELLVKSLLFSVFGGIVIGVVFGGGMFSGAERLFLPFNLPLLDPMRLVIIGAAKAVNFLWPLWDDKSQTLHDKIIGSHVIYDRPASHQSPATDH